MSENIICMMLMSNRHSGTCNIPQRRVKFPPTFLKSHPKLFGSFPNF